MRAFILVALSLVASTAAAQNMWQMNAAYQNQFNQAQAMARPYYGYGYGAYQPIYRPMYQPVYAPAFGGGYYGSDEAFEIRQLNNTLQQIEGNRQLDAIRNQPWGR